MGNDDKTWWVLAFDGDHAAAYYSAVVARFGKFKFEFQINSELGQVRYLFNERTRLNVDALYFFTQGWKDCQNSLKGPTE
jgi:hypothetical protein